jgi:hypothetical protein
MQIQCPALYRSWCILCCCVSSIGYTHSPAVHNTPMTLFSCGIICSLITRPLYALVSELISSQCNMFRLFSLFPVAPTLEQRAALKRFVSPKFLNPKTVGRASWTGDQPVARTLPTQTQNKRRQTSMPWMGFKPTIPVFERAKTVDVLDRVATVIGFRLLHGIYMRCELTI